MSRTLPVDRRRDTHWRGALDLLSVVRRSSGITRAEAARLAGLTSGSATEIAAQLRELSLLDERPGEARGRGRPSTVLLSHPEGPLVLVADVRHDDWRLAAVALDGRFERVVQALHSRDPDRILQALRRAIARMVQEYGDRVRATSVAVPGTVVDGTVAHVPFSRSTMDSEVLRHDRCLPLLVSNDATVAGIAETRLGASSDARAVLYLTVKVGIGGIFVVDGKAMTGASGVGGEFGHLPFGSHAQRCWCGARGCWETAVDGRAIARHLREPSPVDPRTYAENVLLRAANDRSARRAVFKCTAALGAGTAGLVNALDPDLIVFGGLAASLRDAAASQFQRAFLGGLMEFRRTSPPAIRNGHCHEDASLRGAAEAGIDVILRPESLASWAQTRRDPRGKARKRGQSRR